MTTSAPIALLVAHAIESADRHTRTFNKRWRRRSGSFDGLHVCSYCLAELDIKAVRSAVLDFLVPVPLGGPDVAENRVLSCRSCAVLKRNRDLVAWEKFETLGDADHRQALLNRRSEMLSHSLNHLTQTSSHAPREKTLAALQSRWSHPRFTVYAFHGVGTSWLGWTPRNGADDAHALAAVLLRFGCQAVPHSVGKLTLYEVESDRLLDALWVLIDHHAIARPLTIEGLEGAPFDPDDWRHYWPVLLDDLADLHRRRPRLPGSYTRSPGPRSRHSPATTAPSPVLASAIPAHIPTHTPAPIKPRELSQSRQAVALRKKREEQRYQQALGEWLEARATLDAFKKNVRLGLVEAPTLQEWDLMERELFDTYPRRKRPPR